MLHPHLLAHCCNLPIFGYFAPGYRYDESVNVSHALVSFVELQRNHCTVQVDAAGTSVGCGCICATRHIGLAQRDVREAHLAVGAVIDRAIFASEWEKRALIEAVNKLPID